MSRPAPDVNSSGKVDKRVVLFVATVSALLTPFMSSAVNVAIPTIAKEFAVDAVALSWIATVYLLAAAVSLVPLGKIADMYGRKKVLLYGTAGYTIASFLCGVSTSETMLITLRAVQGITGSMMFGTCVAILTSVYPPGERGRVLGITVAAVYIATAIGPFLGGIITQYLSWRSNFFLTGVMGLLVIGLVIWGIRSEWAEAHGEKLDVIGSVLYGVTLLALMNGFSQLPAIMGAGLILFGAVCLAAFVLWESHTPNPVLDIGLFRHNVVFALSNLSALINYASTYALAFLLSLYLQYIKGLDPHYAGMVLFSLPVMMAVFSPLAGRLSDRIEPRILASIGMAVTTVGLLMVIFLNAASGLAYVVLASTVCGIGFGIFSSPNVNATMSSVDQKVYGVASATMSAVRMIGQMLSMGIATLIISVFVGKVQITPQYYPAFMTAFQYAFIVFAALCLVGIFASLARGKMHVETPTDLASLG